MDHYQYYRNIRKTLVKLWFFYESFILSQRKFMTEGMQLQLQDLDQDEACDGGVDLS